MGRALNASLLFVAALGACGGGRLSMPAAPPSVAARAHPWPDGLLPPRLSTVGDLPPERVVVAVEADGRLSVDGEEIALAQLPGYLEKAAASGRSGSGSSTVAAVLAVDEAVPWRVSEWLVEDCARAFIGRVFFAARAPGDELPGAIATFLYEDVGNPPGEVNVGREPVVRVRVRPGDEFAAEPLRLLLPVERLLAGRPDAVVELQPSADVPTGGVLAAVDVLSLAGGAFLSLHRSLPRSPRTGIRFEIQAARRRTRAWGVQLIGQELEGPAPTDPPPRRAAGRYAGFSRTARGLPEVEELSGAPPAVGAPDPEAVGSDGEPADTD